MARPSAPAAPLQLTLPDRPGWTQPLYEAILEPSPAKRPRWIGVSGGRASGKTFALAECCVLAMLRWRANVVACRETLNSIADSSKSVMMGRVEALGLSQYFRETDKEIVCKLGGARAIFRGLSSSSETSLRIKSLEGFSIAWTDEAQAVTQLSLDSLGPTIRTPGSLLLFSWNPHSPDDPVDSFFAQNADDPMVVYLPKVNFDANPHVSQVILDDAARMRRRDPGRYEHIYGGEYRVYSEAQVLRNVSVVEFPEPPQDVRQYLGCDLGFSADPTVLIKCHVIGQDLRVSDEVWARGAPIEMLPRLFAQMPGSKLWPLTIDSSRPETIDYLKRNGYPRARPSIKGVGSIEDGVEFLRSFDIKVHPRCKHTAKELPLYSYKIDAKTGDVLPVISDKFNHCADAIRYGIEGLRRSTYFLSEANIGR